MARLDVVGNRVHVALGRWERLGALRGDVSIPLADVTDVHAAETPFRTLRGLRAPGTGFPGVIALGTWRYRGGKDFVALLRGQQGVVVEVQPGREFRRLIVGTTDPGGGVAAIRAAVAAATTRQPGPALKTENGRSTGGRRCGPSSTPRSPPTPGNAT